MIGSGGALQTVAYMEAGAPPRGEQGRLLWFVHVKVLVAVEEKEEERGTLVHSRLTHPCIGRACLVAACQAAPSPGTQNPTSRSWGT
ncbi:unnamed protein product [Urochloa humidicola]